MKVARKVIFVPIYGSSGSRNGILLSSTLNQAFFDALVNEADKEDRWFPLPSLVNVENTRGENILETFEDNSSVFIQEGSRSFKGWIVEGPPQLKGKIESARCVDIGVFIIDKNGNLIGSISSDGTILYPIKLDKSSVAAMLIWSSDTTTQKLELSFNFSVDEKDENLRMITCDELGDADLLSLNGLLDVNSEISSESTTDFSVRLYTDYGTPINPVLVKGLTISDFSLFNVTDSLAVTITSVTENPEGTYDIDFAAQTSGDVLRLTPTKDGFDFTNVINNPITVP